MQPADIVVITLDGKVHHVALRTPITISAHTGAIVPTQMVDPEDPEKTITVDGRGPGIVEQRPGTRFKCMCGLSFDAENATIGDEPRWIQNLDVDCPNC
jgi:hypothetical protein